MPLLHAFCLAAVTTAIAAATARGRVHPFVAVVMAAAAFAYASGMSVSLLGKVFGTGFGQALNTLGLPVLAAAAIGVMAEKSGAAGLLAAPSGAWSGRRRTALMAAMGVVAGAGASAGGAFAVLAPLRQAVAPGRRGALTLGTAISVGQGLLLPSPVVIAATAILSADWMHVVAVGLPMAALCAAVGSVIGAWAGGESPPAQIIAVAKAPALAIGLVAACLLMVAMLIVQSLGDIPSEPFGGGGARETILGAGRPMVQLLAGGAIMAVATKAWRNNGFSETGWAALAIIRAAPLMLLLGAAGGLQALAQGSHMAELLAEKVLPLPLGLAVPFLAAAVMKTLQGSSLVAAITAAGMAQPLLPALGLDGDMGRALAVLAVGAGAMAVSHVNDGLFWLVGDGAGMRPAQALKWFSATTLLQSAVALAGLLAMRAVE